MIERSAGRANAVYWLLAGYFFVNLIARVLTPGNLEFDESQQAFFSQAIAVGYDSQPPLYNWLQYGVVQVFGASVFALALLKNVMLFLSYLFFGMTAHLVVRDRVLAVIATLALITFPHVGYEAQRDLSHTVALLFATCLFAYFFVRTLLNPSAWNYALTGAAIAAGVLSKYNFVLVPLAAAIALIPDREWRRRLFDPRVILMLAVSAVLVLPHAIWFFENIGKATGETLSKLNPAGEQSYIANVWTGSVTLLEAAAQLVLPTLGVFAVAFGTTLFRARSAQSQWTRFFERFFLIAAVMLVGFVFIGISTEIKTRWVMPFFVMLPIYLAAKVEASGLSYEGAARRFGMVVLAVMVLVPLLIFTRPFFGLAGYYSKHNVPYKAAIAAILATSPDRPSVILAGDQQVAGNLRVNAPDIPVTAGGGYEPLTKPFVFDATHPVLVVWRGAKGEPQSEMNEGLLTWLRTNVAPDFQPVTVRDIARPYNLGREGDEYHFGYAWVYPK